jgi:hypothetical protein
MLLIKKFVKLIISSSLARSKRFDTLKQLGFWSASVSTGKKVGLKYNYRQNTEHQKFYIIAMQLFPILILNHLTY